MKKRSLKTLGLVLAGVAYFSGYVFAATDSLKAKSTTGAPGAAQTGQPMGTGTQAMGTLTDAEILGVVKAVDQHEIDAATKAMKMKMSTEAMAYAKMLKEQHTADKEAVSKLGKTLKMKPAKSMTADSLTAKGEKSMKELASKKGAEFEKAYIEAMVNGHTEVLAMLDSELMPAAQSEAVKSHLTELRGHISAHLEQGKRLQGASASAPQ